ncbi:hypothetical protein TRFO_28552 [Tritrichomonas foetus]|uniref:Uncharacterized protein n=1 Tax=Tritrichomonas foetus TaxID=1144522 RepID=A0A1J4K3E4_9EUKA|nr:hypothetical protein TRFO_28552 [Tritrichomonas foetus]|eukprot:OHT04013.1 hypothetical protein TRFO_28552 [Tritrichomonas foetus]
MDYKKDLLNENDQKLLIIAHLRDENIIEEHDDNEEKSKYFSSLSEQLLVNYAHNDYSAINNSIECIKQFASDKNTKNMLNVFIKYDLASVLVNCLNYNENIDTFELLTCISYCLAHEDEISILFMQNNFLNLASRFLQNQDYIVPIINSLSNIAACSSTNISLILEIIPLQIFINISKTFSDHQKIMEKVSHLFMNIAQKPPVSEELLITLLELSNCAQFPSVILNSLWGIHYCFYRASSWTITDSNSNDFTNPEIFLHNLINFILTAPNNIKYISCLLISDLAKILPSELFQFINFDFLFPVLNLEDQTIVKAALLCFKELITRRINWVSVKLLEQCQYLISSSPFKVKREISETVASMVLNCTPLECIELMKQGILDIFSEMLEMDLPSVKNVVKCLTRLIYALNTKGTDLNEEDKIEQHQILFSFFQNYNIMEQINELVQNYNDENLGFEFKILDTAYKTNFLDLLSNEE